MPDLAVFCAWCRRRRISETEWVDAPEPRMSAVTHGICPPCAGALVRPRRLGSLLIPRSLPCPSALREGCAGRNRVPAEPRACAARRTPYEDYECFCCPRCARACEEAGR